MSYVAAFKKRWATISNDLDSPTVVHPKKLLAQQDLRPQKKLGQNFLIPRPWAKKVLGHITEKPIETVVEIGPGLGALTQPLLDEAQKVIAIEIDTNLCRILREGLGSQYSNLEIRCQDAREVSLESLRTPETSRFVLVGNLPYYLSSPLIRWAVSAPQHVTEGLFTLQKEVAQRIAAKPGNKTYGALSILVQLHVEAKIVLRLPPSAFYPQPDVDSEVIHFRYRSEPATPIPCQDWFEKVVFAGFGQRRKTLFNALRKSEIAPEEDVTQALKEAKIEGSRRAETLSVEEFGALTRALYTSRKTST